MIPAPMRSYMLAATNFAAARGDRRVDMRHVLLALMDEPSVKHWLAERKSRHSDLRELILDTLGEPGGLFEECRRMDLSPLLTIAIERSLAMDHQFWPTTFMETAIKLEYDTEEDFIAVSRLTGLLGLTPEKGDWEFEVRQDPTQEQLPSTLREFTRDLVAEARAGWIDPVVGRNDEVTRIEEVLGRRKKANPVLVGEAGVGKTAVVEELARRIADGKCSPALQGKRLLALNVTKFVSNTYGRGSYEGRVENLVNELQALKNVILFIDEVHTILGGMYAASGTGDMMKPALASGAIRCIGATTHDEFTRYIEPDPALTRRFQSIKIKEPSRDTAVEIVTGAILPYAAHHHVAYKDECFNAAVDLSIKHLPDRQLPDKALDILDEAGAVAAARKQAEVDITLINEVVSRMSGRDVSYQPTVSNLNLPGQGRASREMARAILRAQSGLPKKSTARLSLLMVAPPSYRLDEALNSLAEAMDVRQVRFNLTEFMREHGIDRLIGLPPGYKESHKGGQLTEAVRRDPRCMIVFENVDRTHVSIVNYLTSSLERGEFRDAYDRSIPIHGNIVVFTGESDGRQTQAMGFTSQTDNDLELPEFMEPIGDVVDSIIHFDEQDDEALAEQASITVSQAIEALGKSGKTIIVEGDIKAALRELAKEAGEAVRLRRLLRQRFEDPLLDAAMSSSDIKITLRDNQIDVEPCG